MTEPIEQLLQQMERVRSAFHKAHGDTRKAYDLLDADIKENIPWRLFQQHLPILLAAWERGFQAGLTHQQQRERQAAPHRLMGWSLNQHSRGYWRAFRKVAGKSRCVYLGSKLDLKTAETKLKEKNKKLGVSDGHTT
uniref:Uncharacterized protein n=1 Tax=Magnetococcus massalia (strain MO-1) TaxID=451514 RepID=A0A1S7LMK4_MAGMO|nr:Protein of unknown function [Candidatus Magnetococcus massalia]